MEVYDHKQDLVPTKHIDTYPLAELLQQAQWVENQLIQEMEDGLPNPELEAYFWELKQDLIPKKVEQIDWTIADLEKRAEQIESRIQALSRYQQRCVEGINRLKAVMRSHLILAQKTELQGATVTYKLSPAKPTCVVEDESKIPEEFVETKITKRVDKLKLLEAFNRDGFPQPGVKFEPGFRLTRSIKV